MLHHTPSGVVCECQFPHIFAIILVNLCQSECLEEVTHYRLYFHLLINAETEPIFIHLGTFASFSFVIAWSWPWPLFRSRTPLFSYWFERDHYLWHSICCKNIFLWVVCLLTLWIFFFLLDKLTFYVVKFIIFFLMAFDFVVHSEMTSIQRLHNYIPILSSRVCILIVTHSYGLKINIKYENYTVKNLVTIPVLFYLINVMTLLFLWKIHCKLVWEEKQIEANNTLLLFFK